MFSHPPRCARAIFALLPLWCCGGCDHRDNPQLEFQHVAYWSMPAAEHKTPAPRSLVADGEQVYVLDTAGRVLVFDRQGQVTRQWLMPESDVGKPEDIYVLRDGRIAVADTHYHRVVFFDREGNVLEMRGERGEEPGQYIYPVALAEDPQGNLYVGEYGGNDRVQKFSSDGTWLLSFGGFGTDKGQFQRTSGLVWFDAKVYVSDAINNRIHVFQDDGEYVENLTDTNPMLNLAYPYDIDVGGNGDLLVVEYGAGCVTRLSHSGQLLGRWGTTGSDVAHLATPWGLASDGQRILVADTGNRRVVELSN